MGRTSLKLESLGFSYVPLRIDLTNDVELARLAAAPTTAHPEGEGGEK
jgi:hypothetical protein